MKIYIAGPDVFFQNFAEHFDEIRKKCKEKGFEALIPLDNVCEGSDEIFDANVKMIQDADIVIADLMPFRGKEPDSGTVWECGYAHGLGIPIIGYTSIKDWGDHIGYDHINPEIGMGICSEGYLIEDFGLRQNLMIAHSVEKIVDTFDEALEVVCKILPF